MSLLRGPPLWTPALDGSPETGSQAGGLGHWIRPETDRLRASGGGAMASLNDRIMKERTRNSQTGLLFGIPAAAAYARAPERRIERWMWTRLLPFLRVGKSGYVFRSLDLDQIVGAIEQADPHPNPIPDTELGCPYFGALLAFILQSRALRPSSVEPGDLRKKIDTTIAGLGLDPSCVSAFLGDTWVHAAYCRLRGFPVSWRTVLGELRSMMDRGQLHGLTRVHDVYPGERGFEWRVGNPPPGTLRARITSCAPEDRTRPGFGWAASRPDEDNWPS